MAAELNNKAKSQRRNIELMERPGGLPNEYEGENSNPIPNLSLNPNENEYEYGNENENENENGPENWNEGEMQCSGEWKVKFRYDMSMEQWADMGSTLEAIAKELGRLSTGPKVGRKPRFKDFTVVKGLPYPPPQYIQKRGRPSAAVASAMASFLPPKPPKKKQPMTDRMKAYFYFFNQRKKELKGQYRDWNSQLKRIADDWWRLPPEEKQKYYNMFGY